MTGNDCTSEDNDRFSCPFCGGRVYRSTRRGKQVYKCNDLSKTGINCLVGREAVARTKPQVRRMVVEVR